MEYFRTTVHASPKSALGLLLAFYCRIAADAGVGSARFSLMAWLLTGWAVRLVASWVRKFPVLHHEAWRYMLVRARAGRFEMLDGTFGPGRAGRVVVAGRRPHVFRVRPTVSA